MISSFQSLRYCQYLNYFSFSASQQYQLSNRQVFELGLSFQRLSKIESIKFDFSTQINLLKESVIELSKGIQCQLQLKHLYLTISNQTKMDSEGLWSFMESIKHLKNLEIFSFEAYKNDIVDDQTLILFGNSLSSLSQLIEIRFKIERNSETQISFEKGVESIGSSLKNLNNLSIFIFKLRDFIFLGQKGGMELGKGLGCLTHLQELILHIGEDAQITNEAGIDIANSISKMQKITSIELLICSGNSLKSNLMNICTQSFSKLTQASIITIELSISSHFDQTPFEISQYLNSSNKEKLQIEYNNEYIEKNQCKISHISDQIKLQLTLNIEEIWQPLDAEYTLKCFTSIPSNYEIRIKINDRINSEIMQAISNQLIYLNCQKLKFEIISNKDFKQSIIYIFKGLSQMKNLTDLILTSQYNCLEDKCIREGIHSFIEQNNILSLKFELKEYQFIKMSDCYNIFQEFCQLKNLISFEFSVNGLSNSNFKKVNFQRLLAIELPRLVNKKIIGLNVSDDFDDFNYF